MTATRTQRRRKSRRVALKHRAQRPQPSAPRRHVGWQPPPRYVSCDGAGVEWVAPKRKQIIEKEKFS
jgi:hypothetical protein